MAARKARKTRGKSVRRARAGSRAGAKRKTVKARLKTRKSGRRRG